MCRTQRDGASRCGGYALLTVVVFVLVLTLAGAAFFAIGSSETRQAVYRQRSSEAFYLADGAIERARAKLLEDRTWRDGWTDETSGHGTYDLSIADTTSGGLNNAVFLTSTGDVSNARRRIKVLAELPQTAWGLPMLIGGDAHIAGQLCLEGAAHINGIGGDPHITSCGGTYTEGFTITPPPIYTDPAHFPPNATYYYVRGNKVGSDYYARIYDAAGNNISAALGDSLTGGLVSYHAPTFKYNFDTVAIMAKYFDETTGIFRRNAGTAVVVNFGEPPVLTPPGNAGVAEIELNGSASGASLRTTLINTRFTGVTEEDRLDPLNWMGGLLTAKQLTWEPAYGVAAIAYDFQNQGNSLVRIGSQAWPALLYITHDVPALNSNFELIGSLICLGDFNSSGSPSITYSEGFVPNLPDYLSEEWTPGVSGTLKIVTWREVAAAL